MQLFYYSEMVNFGDTINPWFWSHYIEQPFQDSSDELFVGIGTLINNRLPENFRQLHIMGSGAGYGDFVPKKRDNWQVHCVRGPLTAKALEVDEQLAIADPAILLNELVPLDSKRTTVCGFMPHIGIDSPRLRQVVEDAGLIYISPGDAPQHVIAQTNGCDRLICSAMHGAILAEALRIPWYPVSTSGEILNFKWQDWCLSMGIEKSLHQVPSIWPEVAPGIKGKTAALVKRYLFQQQLRKIEQKGHFVLASEALFEQRKMQLKDTFGRFNQQVAAA